MLSSAQGAVAEMREALAALLPHTPIKPNCSSKPSSTPTRATSPTKSSPPVGSKESSTPDVNALSPQQQQEGWKEVGGVGTSSRPSTCACADGSKGEEDSQLKEEGEDSLFQVKCTGRLIESGRKLQLFLQVKQQLLLQADPALFSSVQCRCRGGVV